MSSSESVESFKSAMSEFKELANQTANIAEKIKLQNFMTITKGQHIAFKANAYDKVLHEDGSVSKQVNHQECAFGKWYEDEGAKTFGKSKIFKDVLAPHRRVHESANKNIEITNNPIVPEVVPELIENFKEMENASYELFDKLDTLIEEI